VLFPLVAASALVPSFLLIWYFRSRDLNPEPSRVVWATFWLGVATVVPVLLVALPLMHVLSGLPSPELRGVSYALLTAAVPEELFKFLVVVGYAARHKEFDEPMDGIVYGAVASLGFATLENVLYVSGGGLGMALMRALTAVPAHAFMGAIMGYYVGQARFAAPERRAGLYALGYFLPMTIHALYDAPLLMLKESGPGASPLVAASLAVSVFVLISAWRWSIALVRRLRADQVAVQAQALAAARLAPDELAPLHVADRPVGAPHALAAPLATGRNTAGLTVALVVGAVLASVGGLITIGVLIGLATGAHDGATLYLVLGTAVIGVLPFVGGVLLFRLGLRRWDHPMPARA
jgi:RsiW-degrading membrane proteinase PrsW (M82 family)